MLIYIDCGQGSEFLDKFFKNIYIYLPKIYALIYLFIAYLIVWVCEYVWREGQRYVCVCVEASNESQILFVMRHPPCLFSETRSLSKACSSLNKGGWLAKQISCIPETSVSLAVWSQPAQVMLSSSVCWDGTWVLMFAEQVLYRQTYLTNLCINVFTAALNW